jgi:AcrR family transcriptional regulator
LASQAERRAATRSALIAAATEGFARAGYESLSTEAVLSRAGVSRGALYHHFASKADLMAAVFEAVTLSALDRARSAAALTLHVRDGVSAALKAWLRAVLAPTPRRIILETGPAALGFARAREIEARLTVEPLRTRIERAVQRGETICASPDLTARLLNAMVAELALAAMERGEPLAELDRQIETVVRALLPEARVPVQA